MPANSDNLMGRVGGALEEACSSCETLTPHFPSGNLFRICKLQTDSLAAIFTVHQNHLESILSRYFPSKPNSLGLTGRGEGHQ